MIDQGIVFMMENHEASFPSDYPDLNDGDEDRLERPSDSSMAVLAERNTVPLYLEVIQEDLDWMESHVNSISVEEFAVRNPIASSLRRTLPHARDVTVQFTNKGAIAKVDSISFTLHEDVAVWLLVSSSRGRAEPIHWVIQVPEDLIPATADQG